MTVFVEPLRIGSCPSLVWIIGRVRTHLDVEQLPDEQGDTQEDAVRYAAWRWGVTPEQVQVKGEQKVEIES